MPKHIYKKHSFPCSLPLDEAVLPHLTSAVFEVAHQPMILLDSVGRIRSVNRAFFQMINSNEDAIRGKSFKELFENTEEDFKNFFAQLLANSSWEGNLTHRRKGGELIEASAYFFELDYPKDTSAYFIGFYHVDDFPPDSLEAKNHLHSDSITDLSTTPLFLEKLDHSLTLAKKRDESLTVFYLDIYQMSHFNQTYGLTHGDFLLKKFAKALTEALPNDAILSRVGGDAFAFALHNSTEHADTHKFLENILASVERQTFFQTEQSLPILHIGACSYPTSTDSAKKLFELAKHSSDLARAYPKTHIVYHKKQ
ncbi:MAG: diguanylate cyclase domain-containing protein [Alphaproteobacteria bacterium]